MKKITALPIKPVISNTICPITQEELKADTYVILHCSSTTSIGVDIEALKDYVLLEQRKFKTPCCLLCRKEDHFKADLITNNSCFLAKSTATLDAATESSPQTKIFVSLISIPTKSTFLSAIVAKVFLTT